MGRTRGVVVMTPLLGLVVVLGRPATKPLDMVPQILGEAGVPTQVVGETQDMAAVVDTTEYVCGSKEMDDYFNEHSGGATERWIDRHRNVWISWASRIAQCDARHTHCVLPAGSVGSIVSQCCDEDSPGYQQCGIYQTACIAAHVASGECKTEDDCDAGCRFFNAVQASCCPHVAKQGTMRLAAQQEQKRIPDGIQLCETELNQAFFDNICGEGSVRAIARDCCGAIGSNVDTCELSNPHPHPHPHPSRSRHPRPRPVQVDRCEALKVKCTDEQIFMQVQDSCCPRPFSPPPPSADLGICSSDEARGTERLAFKRPDAATPK
jgi:hypothetical protein